MILPIIYEDLISSIPLLVDGCAANFSLYSNGGIQTDGPYAAFGGSHSRPKMHQRTYGLYSIAGSVSARRFG